MVYLVPLSSYSDSLSVNNSVCSTVDFSDFIFSTTDDSAINNGEFLIFTELLSFLLLRVKFVVILSVAINALAFDNIRMKKFACAAMS